MKCLFHPGHLPPFIKLEQFLKFAGIADTGGMAKMMILDGIVEVNGEVCMTFFTLLVA